MLGQQGIRRYAFGPVLINVVVMSAVVFFSMGQFDSWVNTAMARVPDWLGFLQWLLWPLFIVLIMAIIIFSFTLLVNIVGAPFNALLSEIVEEGSTGEAPASARENWRQFIASVPRALGREMARLLYTVPIALLIWVLTFVPAINAMAPLLWLAWGAWMMSIQYTDYPADNSRYSFKQLRQLLSKRRALTLSFGLSVTVATMVPLVNLFVMPAAVCGATLMWCEQLGRNAAALETDGV